MIKTWLKHMDDGRIFSCFLIVFAIFPFLISKSYAKSQDVESRNKSHMVLGLIAYNYTDRFIEEYSVDGAGGGHVHQSSPTSGGSGVVCCATLSKELEEKILVTVKWQFDGCVEEVKGFSGRTGQVRHFHYKESRIYLDPPSSKDAAYLETHFYPDGTVKVRVTDGMSLPELRLDEDREDISKFPKCENNEVPK